MENKVVKVITQSDSIIFVISFEGEFFTWEISEGDWLEYWSKQDKRLYLYALNHSPEACNKFVNDPVNDTVGTSTASFKTVEDALRYYEII